jgi:hypothetical protein
MAIIKKSEAVSKKAISQPTAKPYIGTPEQEDDESPAKNPGAPVKAPVAKKVTPVAKKDDRKPSVFSLTVDYLLENKHTDEEIIKLVSKEKKVPEDKIYVAQVRGHINSSRVKVPDTKAKLLPLHRWTRNDKDKLVEFVRTKPETKPKGKEILKKAIGSLPKG